MADLSDPPPGHRKSQKFYYREIQRWTRAPASAATRSRRSAQSRPPRAADLHCRWDRRERDGELAGAAAPTVRVLFDARGRDYNMPRPRLGRPTRTAWRHRSCAARNFSEAFCLVMSPALPSRHFSAGICFDLGLSFDKLERECRCGCWRCYRDMRGVRRAVGRSSAPIRRMIDKVRAVHGVSHVSFDAPFPRPSREPRRRRNVPVPAG